ncbi:cytochrome P450 94B3 [Cinnamomum micranthum f. kanehirae]|uniref:Cytochrome P450 94B3 n=1 Tax=Cinnamomum micranthum f. kanehirae TaxID=337451 RepID=A0A3S3N357_9MAGN|nr:cytochrome P450 94B3 [Cinnamomum micranthum f. kanehirae]
MEIEMLSSQALLLLLVSILSSSLLFLFSKKSPSKKSNGSSGFVTYPIVGNLPPFLKNRHRWLQWLTEVLREQPTNMITFWRPGNLRGVITANPANVEHILKTNFLNYPKGERFITTLEDFLGQGIFNSDGDLWKVQRKTASFEFNTKSLRNFVVESVRDELLNRLFPILTRASKTSETLDLQDILERFAFDNVCKVAFNEDPMCLAAPVAASGQLSPDFANAFETATSLSSGRFRYVIPYLWKIKKLLNIGSEKKLKEAISIVHSFAMKIIQDRKKAGPATDTDLLSRFMASTDSSDELLRDIVVSFILAGRDTTSSTLAWFFWLLSSRPDVEKNIREEVKKVRAQFQNNDQTFSFEELREMHYLHAAISEALRLYPPVSVDTKACLKDDVLPDGTFVGKGWFVTYNAYAMGRMEAIWGKDCEEYVPERWLDNGVFRTESPYRFPVFHAGPRMCLGREMAYIQMKSIVALVVENFQIDVLGKDTCPEHMLSLTLRMKYGLPVRVGKKGVDKIE